MKHLKFELTVIDYPCEKKEANDEGKRINILTTGQDIPKDNTDFDCSINCNNCSIKRVVQKIQMFLKGKVAKFHIWRKDGNSTHSLK